MLQKWRFANLCVVVVVWWSDACVASYNLCDDSGHPICQHEEELLCGYDPNQDHCRSFLRSDESLAYCDANVNDMFCSAKLRKPLNTFCVHQPDHPSCKSSSSSSSGHDTYGDADRSKSKTQTAPSAKRAKAGPNFDQMTTRQICASYPEHPRCRLSFCQYQVGNPACEEYFSSGGDYVADQQSTALPPKHQPITKPDDAITDSAPFKPLDPWLHSNTHSVDYGVVIGCGVVVGTWLLLSSYSVRQSARKHRETLLQRVEVFEAGALEADEVRECIQAQEHVTELLDFHSEVRQYLEYCRMLDEELSRVVLPNSISAPVNKLAQDLQARIQQWKNLCELCSRHTFSDRDSFLDRRDALAQKAVATNATFEVISVLNTQSAIAGKTDVHKLRSALQHLDNFPAEIQEEFSPEITSILDSADRVLTLIELCDADGPFDRDFNRDDAYSRVEVSRVKSHIDFRLEEERDAEALTRQLDAMPRFDLLQGVNGGERLMLQGGSGLRSPSVHSAPPMIGGYGSSRSLLEGGSESPSRSMRSASAIDSRDRKSEDEDIEELNRSMDGLSLRGDDADLDDLNRQMGALTLQDDGSHHQRNGDGVGGGRVDNVVGQFLDQGVDPRSSKAFGHLAPEMQVSVMVEWSKAIEQRRQHDQSMQVKMASLQVDVAKFHQAADHARSKLAVKKKHHKELLQNDKENRVVLKEQGKLRGEELRAHRERMETFENTLAEQKKRELELREHTVQSVETRHFVRTMTAQLCMVALFVMRDFYTNFGRSYCTNMYFCGAWRAVLGERYCDLRGPCMSMVWVALLTCTLLVYTLVRGNMKVLATIGLSVTAWLYWGAIRTQIIWLLLILGVEWVAILLIRFSKIKNLNTRVMLRYVVSLISTAFVLALMTWTSSVDSAFGTLGGCTSSSAASAACDVFSFLT